MHVLTKLVTAKSTLAKLHIVKNIKKRITDLSKKVQNVQKTTNRC
jgi:hypothetical protein